MKVQYHREFIYESKICANLLEVVIKFVQIIFMRCQHKQGMYVSACT